jgi:hypothetical protein
MAILGSDHIPILIQIGIDIPKCNIFRFEEYWLEFEGFKEVVENNWVNKGLYKNCAHELVARFKSLRHGIKKWSKHLSELTVIINNCSYVIAMLDGLEDQRTLSIIEIKFRNVVKLHLGKLLEAKRLYWRKRANIRWAKLGDENTKFFHAMATRNYRNNKVAMIQAEDGRDITNNEQKHAILWNSFKGRLGQNEECQMMFDLSTLITPQDLSSIEDPFSTDEIDSMLKHMPNDKSPGPDGF